MQSRIALISTTINIPEVLALYRKSDFVFDMFIAGDLKSPPETESYLKSIERPTWGRIFYYGPERQRTLGYRHSELIGWNSDSRRNIALLEALKSGAEIIISVDDDMAPLSPYFFQRINELLTRPFSGLQLGDGHGYWVDVGQFTIPPAPQRGLPPNFAPMNCFSFVHDVQVGALQGIILGTPDTDSITTMAKRPVIHSATDILRNGLVVNPGALSVLNSQFTAFRRELAPAFGQFYKWQHRNTDIFASMIMRRVMQEKNLYTYFGPPFGFHARAERDPMKDLKAEMYGLDHIQQLAGVLGDLGRLAVDKPVVRQIYEKLNALNWWPRENAECVLAWLDDVEGVL